MSYNVIQNPAVTPVTSVEQWASQYKDSQIEMLHDQSMLTLATPDDSLLVVGPPRLVGTVEKFHVVGMVNSFNYNDASQVQPFKAIGSRRHVFSKTSAPVSGSIARMVILGPNLFRALYSLLEAGDISPLKQKNFSMDKSSPEKSAWYTNLEEDLYRFPIGLGVIYKAPVVSNTTDYKNVVGAEYIENCVIMGRSVGMQSGAAMIMEQVSFMADRVIPWRDFKTVDPESTNPAKDMLN